MILYEKTTDRTVFVSRDAGRGGSVCKAPVGRGSGPEDRCGYELEEKAGLLVGTSMEGYAGEGAVTGRTLKTVPGSAGTTRSLESYGIRQR